MLIILLALLAMEANEEGIPNLDVLIHSGDFRVFEPYLASESKVRLNLSPLIQERGQMSSGQVLFCLRKLFQRYDIDAVHQSEFRSDTNYSQIEMTVQFRFFNRATGHPISGAFLIMFHFRDGRPWLSKWMVTEFEL